MILVVDTLVVVLPLLYVATVLCYGLDFFGKSPSASRWCTPLLITTIIIHLLYVVARTVAFDHTPVTTVYEIMTLLAVSIAVAYLYIEFKAGTRNTGFFILLLALTFQVVSSIFIKDLAEVAEVLRSRLLGFHVSTALLGYTAISLSAVYGFLYLMLYHEIKSSRFGVIYNRLPNLEMLENMSHKAEVFGFMMLTIAILIGVLWLPHAFESFSYWDPKLVGTVLIWVLYAVGLAAKRQFGWQGRRMMILSIVAFGFVFLSMTVVNIYLSGFHSFH